jgi:hypothetical protein
MLSDKLNLFRGPGFMSIIHPQPSPTLHPTRKGLWIGLAIGAILLCLCCIFIAGIYFFRQDIPFISSFFPSPTPTGLFYNNPAAGISLTYPATWRYSESGDALTGYSIIFASSEDILANSSNNIQTGAAFMVWTNILSTSDLSFTVSASSMADVVDFIVISLFSGISQGQNLHTFTLSGYPAASGLFSISSDSGNPSDAYITAVLRNTEIIMFVGVCPSTEWTQHQPTFDTILDSVNIITP